MSILTISHDDMKGGKGQPLPVRKYSGIFEESAIENGDGSITRFVGRIGQITTSEGQTEFDQKGQIYRIGNRKIFVREWIDHPSDDARRIGNQRLGQLAIAAGLVPVPGKGETVELPFESWDEYASAVAGKRVTFTSKQRIRKTKDGQTALDPDGDPIVDAEVNFWHAP